MVGVMDILSDDYKYAVLFLLKMDSRCLGLHDKNMRCEVITIQNYCYALVSCPIFLLTDDAVGTGVTAFGRFGVTFCIWRVSLPFVFCFGDTRSGRPVLHADTAVNPSTGPQYCNMFKVKDHLF